jgi:hypothetical protein
MSSAAVSDPMTQLMPAWVVNAISAPAPAAYSDPGQVLGFGFDVQQMLTQQCNFWGDLMPRTSQLSVQGRTIHQDPDEVGYWFESD